jgi:CsoR family transcriptional regulator, copper-sensing transcriptional repressor
MSINQVQASDTDVLIQRLRRIQGQLKGLECLVEKDGTCEEIVIRAYTVEKAVASFIMQVLDDYFECHINTLLEEDPEAAKEEIRRLFQLVNRWSVSLGKDN